jgi:hypothetical protein
LVQKENEIKRVKSFDELLNVIESVNSKRIASLTQYDTAVRIGAYLNLFPEKIYLHTGTKIGVRNLLGKLNGKKYIEIKDLPSEFQKYSLTALEDIFCHYKDCFKNLTISNLYHYKRFS